MAISPKYDYFRKRIVVCCDGTWQSSVSGEKNIPSNVTRLCRSLAREGVEYDPVTKKTTLWKQICFYDAGIGTGNLNVLDTLRQGGTGAGLAHNVFECYNFIVNNYKPGDKIYCFGFSRGAYTARSLSGFITTMGICSPLDMMAFPIIYDMYEEALPFRKGEHKRDKEIREKFWGVRDPNNDDIVLKDGLCQAWIKGDPIPFTLGQDKDVYALKYSSGAREPIHPDSMKVEVVGVWDTVGSLGVPKIFGWFSLPSMYFNKPGHEFHDVTINANVQNAFHAMALDERRLPFQPTLWYAPSDDPRPKRSLKQVWFPGCHINVGGGSDDVLEQKESDFEQLANITFAWMLQQCRPFLTFDMRSFDKAIEEHNLMLEALNHKAKPLPKTWLAKPFVWIWRQLQALLGQKLPTIHAHPGWGVGPVVDSYKSAGLSIRLGGAGDRAPGEVKQPESISNRVLKNPKELGETNEYIHPCVWYRLQHRKPTSGALDQFQRVQCITPEGKHGWEWVKTYPDGRVVRIPEYQIDSDEINTSTTTSTNGRITRSSAKNGHYYDQTIAEIGVTSDTDKRNFERITASAGHADAYIAKLDRMYTTGVDETVD